MRAVSETLRRMAHELSQPPMVLAQAEANLIAQCLTSAGFRYIPWESWSRRIPRPATRLGGLGIPLQVETARENGYAGLVERIPEDDDPDGALEQYLASLAEHQLESYYRHLDPEDSPRAGVTLHRGIAVSAATTGCAADARRYIYGGIECFLRIHNFVNELAGHRIEVDEDPRVRDSLAAYRLCMRQAGHDVADTADARSQANARYGNQRKLSDPVPDEESAMALADAEAQRASGINSAIEEALMEILSDWLNDNETHITALHQDMHRAVTRANIALTGLSNRPGG